MNRGLHFVNISFTKIDTHLLKWTTYHIKVVPGSKLETFYEFLVRKHFDLYIILIFMWKNQAEIGYILSLVTRSIWSLILLFFHLLLLLLEQISELYSEVFFDSVMHSLNFQHFLLADSILHRPIKDCIFLDRKMK